MTTRGRGIRAYVVDCGGIDSVRIPPKVNSEQVVGDWGDARLGTHRDRTLLGDADCARAKEGQGRYAPRTGQRVFKSIQAQYGAQKSTAHSTGHSMRDDFGAVMVMVVMVAVVVVAVVVRCVCVCVLGGWSVSGKPGAHGISLRGARAHLSRVEHGANVYQGRLCARRKR